MTSNFSSCVQGFRKILRLSPTERKKSWVMYIWRGKSYLILVHNFTNHAQHFVKLIDYILILALITHHVNLLPSSYKSYVFQWLSLGWKESEKTISLWFHPCNSLKRILMSYLWFVGWHLWKHSCLCAWF